MYKILFLISVLLIFPAPTYSQQNPPRHIEQCLQFLPYGFPKATRLDTTKICRTAYATEHDNIGKIPIWVAYSLSKDQVTGCYPRVNAFSADQSLRRGKRAELSDYLNSGFDMGHMVNNADMSWNPIVARETFILSNIAPQTPNLNRGVWKTLEAASRAWAFKTENGITIYTGSIFNYNTSNRIGENKVIVPEKFFKIIVNNDSKKSLSFIFPNQENLNNSLSSFQTTVNILEQTSGIIFPIPDNKMQRYPLWNFNSAQVNQAKKSICTP